MENTLTTDRRVYFVFSMGKGMRIRCAVQKKLTESTNYATLNMQPVRIYSFSNQIRLSEKLLNI